LAAHISGMLQTAWWISWLKGVICLFITFAASKTLMHSLYRFDSIMEKKIFAKVYKDNNLERSRLLPIWLFLLIVYKTASEKQN
jgi:hypothetical protein